MSFTDEALKEWGESVAAHLLPGEKQALIARLKAAEVCAELTYFHYGGGSEAGLTPMALELKQSSEGWRKAAGKHG